jgi:hypothetical protein
MDQTISNVGEKLIVGQLDTSVIPGIDILPKLMPGTAVLNGPVYIGGVSSPGIARATCMIGPSVPGVAIPAVSLEVDGLTNLIGATNQFGAYTCEGVSVFLGIDTDDGASIKNSCDIANLSKVINGPLVVNGAAHINGFLSFTSSIVGVTKDFLIKHPIKDGYLLRHGCLEGPEYGVYYRGKLKGGNVINLPDYWEKLINPETITVQLTPNTTYQELYVKKIQDNKINILNNSGSAIDCDFIIHAERIDVDKLIVETEGKLPQELLDEVN